MASRLTMLLLQSSQLIISSSTSEKSADATKNNYKKIRNPAKLIALIYICVVK